MDKESGYEGNIVHSLLGYEEKEARKRYTFDELHPGYREVRNLMPDMLSGQDYIKYERLQTNILYELDKIMPYFDFKKDKKIKLPFNKEDLFMIILDSYFLKIGSNPRFANYDYVIKPIYHVSKKFINIAYLRMLDLSSICLDGLCIQGLDLSYTNIEFDPQRVVNRDVCGANFEGMDCANKDFTDVLVIGTNFKNCKNLNLNPQKVQRKLLMNTNLKNVDMRGYIFDDVNVEGAVLEGTGAEINPQTICCNSLLGTNCKGLDLKNKSFDNCIIDGANLDYTNANIDPQKLDMRFISYPADSVYLASPLRNGKGYASLVSPQLDDSTLFQYHVQDTVNNPYGKRIEYYNSVYYPCRRDLTYYHSMKGTSLRGIDFKGKSFKNVDIQGATIDDKFANIDPQLTCHVLHTINGDVVVRSLKNTTLENVNLENKSFNNVIVDGIKLINTNAHYNKKEIVKDFELEPITEYDEVNKLPISVRRQVLGKGIWDIDENGKKMFDSKVLGANVFRLKEKRLSFKKKPYEAPISVLGTYNPKIMDEFYEAVLQISEDFVSGKYDSKETKEKKSDNNSIKELYKRLRI